MKDGIALSGLSADRAAELARKYCDAARGRRNPLGATVLAS